MKDAYYFQHDSNAHNDPKMLSLRISCGWEGVGLYWTFLEILRDIPNYKYLMTNNYLKEISLRLSLAQATLEAWLKQACETGLLVQRDGFLYSESFLRRMIEIDKKRVKLSEAGRRGGLKSSQAQARLKPGSSSKVKDSKVKDIFTPPTIEDITAYCLERKNGVAPNKWRDHYQAKGWLIGKSKMKDWQAAVRTWENKDEIVKKKVIYA